MIDKNNCVAMGSIIPEKICAHNGSDSYHTQVIVQLNNENAKLPLKANPTDACYDLFTPEDFSLEPFETISVNLGLAIELKEGWEAQIKGRSGLAKKGIIVHNGTIDHLYRSDISVIMYNFSKTTVHFKALDRIAQMKIEKVWQVNLTQGTVTPTQRGGFGSTGR